MKYNYKELRELSDNLVRQIVISMFKRYTDEDIRNILLGKYTPEQCRNVRYYIESDCIKIGYYEGWDDAEVYVILYEDRIELTKMNKFHPLTRSILMDFRK